LAEDYQIIQDVLNGDREAYAELVRSYHPRVYNLCLSLLLNPSEADDAAQEVFVKAYAALAKHKPDLSFPAWLHRIASNHCLDLLRKRKRQKTDSLDQLMGQSGDHFEGSSKNLLDSEERSLERDEKVSLAKEALATLTLDQRQVLILRELEGLSYEEISVTLECSLDTVKSRLHRARHHLLEKARHFLKERSSI
jgi:RNA polymerase sigma-70 factor (ECF subfamily)